MSEPLEAPAFNAKENSFLQHLKAATDWNHRHLESQSLLQSLMLSEVNVEQYYLYLCLMKEIAKTYEQVVLPMLTEWLQWLVNQPSSRLLEQDLAGLRPFVSNSIKSQAFTVDSREVSLPFAWGFAYVMEGSKLGGKVIFKHLKKSLKHRDNEGYLYLTGNGADTSMQWKEFLQQLSHFAATKKCGEEIIRGAIFCFTSVYEYFELHNSTL